MVEPGQRRNSAALISSMCVHIFFGDVYMNKYIDIIIKEANKSLKSNDIPVGSIIIQNNKIISKSHNTKYKNKQSIEHAEINCIKKACKKLKSVRLDDCILITTLEPCNMCIGAIVESHIKEVYYLLDSNYIESTNNFKRKIKYQKINLSTKYEKILKNYFKNIR